MLKLNVLLAKTDHLASSFMEQIRSYIHFFSKNDKMFTGEKKTYQPMPDTVDIPSDRGHRLVVTTVAEKLKYFEENVAEYINAKFAQEATNASGLIKAPLIVEGSNWGEYSSLELLALKTLLSNGQLVEMYSLIPVRADNRQWEDCTEEEYEGREIVQSPILRGEKKSIVKEQYILSDPNVQYLKDTSKYQPMVGTRDTPLKLGEYSFQEFSGEWTAKQRAEVLRRRSVLLNAVIEAIKVANEGTVVSSGLTSSKVFKYLHYGQIN